MQLFPSRWVFSLWCRKGKAFCVRPSALHCQQPEKDTQNVDFPPPGKISVDTHVRKESLMDFLFIHSFSCLLYLWGGSRGSNLRRTRNTSQSTAISGSSAVFTPSRGVKRGKGGSISPAPNHYGGTELLQGAPNDRGSLKSLNNVTSTFFNTVYLFPKDLRFEHRTAKLASCRGRHLTSLRP